MPVVDTPVHEKVKQKEGAKWACFGVPFSGTTRYVAPDRKYREDGTWENVQREIVTEWITGRKNDGAVGDVKCEGCPLLPCGEKYAEEIRRNGK